MTVRAEIVQQYAAGSLFKFIVQQVRGHQRDDTGETIYAELIDLHNSGEIDVLCLAHSIADAEISQHDFFLIQHVYVQIIPNLKATVSAMLEAVKALVSRAGNDLAGGRPNDAFKQWAGHDDRARAALALLDPTDPDDAPYIFLALSALGSVEVEAAQSLAIEILAGEAATARLSAARVLGQLPLADTEARWRSLHALQLAYATSPDDQLSGQITAAAAEIARRDSVLEAEAIKLIELISNDAGDATIHHASLMLMFHAEEWSPEALATLTKIALRVQVANRGTLENIDHAAARMLQHGKVDEALDLIAPLLVMHHDLGSFEELDGFAYGMLQLGSQRLTCILVKWLLSSEPNLGEAAFRIVSKHHGDPLILEFDAAALSLSDSETVVLAHRSIGYLFMQPITAASILLSLIRVSSQRVRSTIEEILFDPLLINYAGGLAEWLKAKSADDTDPAQEVIERVLTRLDAYLDGLRRVGVIKELRPSERERLIESHRRHESMLRAHKEAEKRSVLLSIVSRSILLYGNRSISYVEGPTGPKDRHELKLQSFSHSIEAPRLHLIEPFEIDYKLRLFRAMRVR